MEELKQLAECGSSDCLICPKMVDQFSALLGVGDSERRPCISILARLWDNLLQDPINPRYRTVPLNADRIKRDLAPIQEAIDFMASVGWEKNGNTLVFMPQDVKHIKLSKILFSKSESLSASQQKYVAEKHKEYLAQQAEKRSQDYRSQYSKKWRLIEKPIIKGIKGLKNLGNTCFFNSVMQCLLQTRSLTKIQIPNFAQNAGYPNKDELDSLSSSTCRFFEEMWTIGTSPSTTFSPQTLFTCFLSKAPKFGAYIQQDSEEFLRCFFDELESEKNKLDFVTSIFRGKLCSTIECLTCGTESLQKEGFITLSLSLPSSPIKIEAASKPLIDIKSCLEQFVQSETLLKEEGNGVQCFTCTRKAWVDSGTPIEKLIKFYPAEEKSHVDTDVPIVIDPDFKPDGEGETKPKLILRTMKKTLQIEEPPDCLIIHLKRFQQNESGKFEKNSAHVDIPSEINLSPYLKDKREYNYKLYGYCSHLGRIDGGHYTATTHLLDPNSDERFDWYFISDEHYHKIQENELERQNAYLAFYEKCTSKEPAMKMNLDDTYVESTELLT